MSVRNGITPHNVLVLLPQNPMQNVKHELLTGTNLF